MGFKGVIEYTQNPTRSGFKTSDQVQGQGAGRSRKRSIHGYVSIYRRLATQPLGLRWGFEATSNPIAGRVAERLKAAASKAVEGHQALREFESHPFRQ